jgi:hypothetical protein
MKPASLDPHPVVAPPTVRSDDRTVTFHSESALRQVWSADSE